MFGFLSSPNPSPGFGNNGGLGAQQSSQLGQQQLTAFALAAQQSYIAQLAQQVGYSVASGLTGQAMGYPSLAPPAMLGSLGNTKPTNLGSMRDMIMPVVYSILSQHGSPGDDVKLEVDLARDCIVLHVNGVQTEVLSRREIEEQDYGNIGPRLLAALQRPLPKEIHAGEIIAWRVWRWNGTHLRSTAMDTIWKPNEPMKAGTGCEGIGAVGGGYGVHAWRDKADAMKYASEYLMSGHMVVGQVELWGEVMEHEAGYRAEYANIISIDEGLGNDFWPWQLKAIRNLYLPVIETKNAA